MPIFSNPVAFHNRLAQLKLVDIVNKSEFVYLWRTLFQVLLPCQCIDPHYFMSTSRIKVRGPDSVVAQGWFHVTQKSFLLVACVDKHRNTKKCRGRTSQSLEKDLLSESSFPSWFHTSVNSLGHCNIYCFIYNEYIITTIFHFPGFLDHLFKSTVCLFALLASAFHSTLLKLMASFQGTQVCGSDIGKHRAVELFWPKQILLRTTVIHLLVLKLIHLFSAYLMHRWFVLYLLGSKIF